MGVEEGLRTVQSEGCIPDIPLRSIATPCRLCSDLHAGLPASAFRTMFSTVFQTHLNVPFLAQLCSGNHQVGLWSRNICSNRSGLAIQLHAHLLPAVLVPGDSFQQNLIVICVDAGR